MKIPREFNLTGQKITTEIIEYIKDHDAHGTWSYSENKIRVATKHNGKPVNKEKQFQTFCHEWAHAALDHYGWDNLSENEKLVDNIGSALYELLKTKK